ncbi:MAG: glutamate 5-kinase [Rhodobacteraceae bacterium]|nr:glutamate 5-kinase [Paracoccaceae bacterium]
MVSVNTARRLVVKIGSSLLVSDSKGLRQEWLQSLVRDIAALKARGADVVVVSSGSIALGRMVLGLSWGELPLEQSQAAAAVGQIRLARAYEQALAPHGITTGQVLLTLEDSLNRRRYLNVRATLAQLMSLGVVPIVNENDTVATDEIRYGDNDRLAAQVALTIEADCLILLSDVDGLYSGNPAGDPNARHFPIVREITPAIEAMAGEGRAGLSKGGMITKLMAAKTATAGGCAMVIARGTLMRPLQALMRGGKATWFPPKDTPQQARKRWIAAMKTRGQLGLDEGAIAALRRGSSLLPAGIMRVSGPFERGDPVDITTEGGEKIGQGLVGYDSKEAQKIMGAHSHDIEARLGYTGRAALIHRDDMVLQR